MGSDSPDSLDASRRLHIRTALPTDVAAIQCLYAHYVRTHLATFELDPPDQSEMARRMAAIDAAGFPYLVAVIDGTLVGYAYANHYRLRPAYQHTVENSIYLDPHWTARGFGRRLLMQLIDDCACRGFRQMIAVIGDSANEASVRLHARCGFDNIGTLPAVGHKFGRWVDSVLMQRALGPGASAAPTRR